MESEINGKKDTVCEKSRETIICEDEKKRRYDEEEMLRLTREKEYNVLVKQRIELKVRKEKENNVNSLAQYAGQPVGYGSEMQIMHVDSKLFLSS